MNKFLFTLGCLFCIVLANAQTRYVNISTGTIVTNSGVQVNFNGGYGAIATPSEIRVYGNYIDTVAGTLNLYGPTWFRYSGTTDIYNLTFNGGKMSYFQSTVSVFNSATNNAGDTSDFNDGSPDIGLWLRTDIPGHQNAYFVNNGVVYDSLNGLQTYATVTTGGCPSTSYTSNLSVNISGTTILYQWQSSLDSNTWSTISGATNATYTATVTSTYYYNCVITETTTPSTGYEQFTPGIKLVFTGGGSAPAIGGTFSVCNLASTTLTDATSGGTWSSSNTGVATIGTSGSVTGVSAGTTIITYNTGCGTPATQSFTVNAIPTVNTVSSQTKCNATSTSAITFSGTGGGVYNWTNSNAAIGTTTSGTGNIAAFTATNSGSSPIAGNFSVTATNSGCTSAAQTFTITVNPTPTVSAISNQSLCNGATSTAINFTGGVSGATYNWVNSNSAIGTAASGSGNISAFTATNSGTAPIAGNFTVTPTANSCNGTAQTFTITVNPTPNVVVPSSQTICAGQTAGPYNFSGSVSGTSYSWTNSNTSIGFSSGSGTGNISSFTGANSGTSAAMAVFSVTPSANTCPGTAQSFTLTVNPTPNVVVPSNQTICNGQIAGPYNFSGSVSGTSYSWTNSNTSIGFSSGSGTGNISSFTGANSGTSAAMAVFSVTPSANTCPGTAQSFTLTVNPTPNVVVPSSQAICAGQTAGPYNFSGSVTGTSYSWTNSNTAIGFSSASGTGNISSFTGANAGTSPVMAIFSVTPSANSCPGTAQSFTLTVNPTPNVVVPSNQTICNGQIAGPYNFSGSVSGTSYSWTNSNTSIGFSSGSGTGNISSFTGANSGTSAALAIFSVTPSANSCPGTAQSFTLTVNPTPNVVVPSSQSICNGQIAGPYNFSGSVTGTSYSWTNSNTSIGFSSGSGTGNISSFTGATGSAVFSVTPTANSCPGTAQSFTLTVNAIPTVLATNNSFCSGTGPAALTASGATTYTWTPAATLSASTGATVNANPTITTVYTVTGTTAGCSANATDTLTILSSTAPITGSATACIGASTTLSDLTPGGSWTSSDVSIATVGSLSGSVMGVTAGTVAISYISGCGTVMQTVTVNPIPSTSPVSSQIICNSTSTSAITFTGTDGGATYNWTNSNASIGTATSGTGNISAFTATNSGSSPIQGAFSVTASSNGCTGTAQTFTITVNPTPTVTTPSNQSVCNGANSTAVNFTGAVSGTSYTWANDNTSIGLASTGTGNISAFPTANSGSTNIQGDITVTPSANGCPGTAQTFTITVKPTPNVSSVSNQVVCNTNSTSAINFTGAVTGTTYAWTNSNTSIGTVGSGSGNISAFTGTNSGTSAISGVFSVTPTANSCPGTGQTFTVTVNPTPNVSPVSNQAICNTASSTTVNFSGSVSGTSYTWGNSNTSIGLASTGTSVIASFGGTNSGTAPIQGIISVTPSANGCAGSVGTFTITVNPTPTVNTVSGQTVCNAAPTTAINFTGAVSGTTYAWSNDNTAIGTAGSGSGNISAFTATNSGTSAISGDFSVTPSANGCSGTAQTFTVTVNPTPTVNTPSNQAFCNTASSTEVDFSGAVSGATYTWANSNTSIGLASSGTGNILAFAGTNSGSSPIQGVISVTPSANGCPGAQKTFTITVNPTPTVNSVTGQSVCNTASTSAISFSGAVSGTSYSWTNDNTSIGLGSSGTGTIAPFAGTNSGTTAISGDFSVTPSANGCSGSAQTFTVTVNPTPTVTTPSSQAICNTASSAEVDFSGAVSGATYSWANSNTSIGLASTGTGNILAFSATNSGSSPIQGVISVTPSASSCPGTAQSFTITVNPTPTVNSVSGQTLCNTANTTAINFSGSVSGATYSWTNDNTAIGVGASGTGTIAPFAATNSGTTAISGDFSVTPSANGCSGSAQTFTITVNPTPSAISGVASLCFGLTTTLSDGMTGGTWASSNTATGTIDPSTGVFSAIAAGTTTITYTLATCINTELFTVNTSPSAISGPSAVCTGSGITLTDASSGGTWTSTTANATVNPSSGAVTGVMAGTTIISYSLGAGCATGDTVTINQTPSAISGTPVVCLGTSSTLGNTYGGGAWASSNPGTGSIDPTSGSLTGVNAGTAIITYTISGCAATTEATVNAAPATIGGASMVCNGLTTTLTDGTTGGSWSSTATGTATIDPVSGLVTGVSPGITTISYALGASCYTTQSMTVNPVPTAITGITTACITTTTSLSETASGGVWSSSNTAVGTVSASGVVYGVAAGTTVISYSMICGVVTTTVTIYGALPAITGASPLCRLSTSLYTDPVPGGTWSSSASGVASVGTDGTVTAVTAGLATITYSIGSGCLASSVVTVLDNSPIQGAQSVCNGLTTGLTDSIPGGLWTSSNPAISIVNCNLGIVKGLSAGTSIISYTLPSGCVSTETLTVISLLPISGVNTLCTGATSTLTNSTAGGAWSSSDNTIASIGSSTGVVTGIAPGNVVISYIYGTTGCTVTSGITVLTITTNIPPTLVCMGSGSTIYNSTVGGAWTSSNTGVATVVSGTGLISGVSAGNAVITYSFGATCVTTSSVTVNAIPSAVTVSGGGTYCGSATITASGGGGGTIYFQGTTSGGTSTATPSSSQVVTTSGTYYFRAQTGAGCWGAEGSVTVLVPAISGPLNICSGTTATLTNTGGAATWSSSNPSVATIGSSSGLVSALTAGSTVITSTEGGCVVTANVTVAPAPSISGPSTVCVGQTISLNNPGQGGTWTTSAPTIATVGSTGIVTGIAPYLSANITYTFNSTCRATFTVSVNPLNVITGPTFVCAGQTITMADATTGGTWSSSSTGIASVVTGTGVVSGINSGSTTITYTTPAGCVGTTPVTVKVLTPSTGPSTVCAGQSITLSNATPGGTWTSSQPTIAVINSGNGIVVGIAGISVTLADPISYTLGSGCITVYTVSVLPSPAILGSTSVCQGSTATVNTLLSGGTWASSNMTVATIGTGGTVTGVGGGYSTISYTMPTGCVTTEQYYVNPVAAITGPPAVCVGQTITLGNPAGAGTWSTSAPTIATIGSTSGIVTGIAANLSATITYTFCTGCRAYTTVTVSYLSAIGGPSSVCQGQTITLTNSGAGGVWSSSAPGTATVNPSTGVVTGVSAGPVTISYALGTSCTAYANITVNTMSPITGPSPSVVCNGLTITLSNAITGGTWQSAAPTIATVGSLSGIVTGVAGNNATTITYTNPGGCKSFATVSVNPLSATSGPTSVCQGQTITLANSTAGGGVWSSSAPGTASIGTNGVVTGVSTGSATISFSLPSGCVATYAVSVITLAGITGPTSVCNGLTVTLGNTTPGGTWSGPSTQVTVGSLSGNVTGIASNTYPIISYTLASGCRVTYAMTVNALANIGGPTSVCQGQTITATYSPATGTWSSGTLGMATIGTNGVITGVAGGTALISYSVPDGCTATEVVTVNPLAPVTGAGNVCKLATITLGDATPGGTWQSGSPTIASVVSGTGVVTGVAANLSAIISYILPSGCKAWATVSVVALPTAPGTITGPASVSISGSPITLGCTPTGGTWSASNGNATVNATTGVVTGVTVGSVILTYTVTNAAGCTNYNTKNINVGPTPPPPSSITNNTLNLTEGTSQMLTEATTGGTWNLGEGSGIITLDEENGLVTGVAPGRAIVTYTLTGDAGTTLAITEVIVNTAAESIQTTDNAGDVSVIPNPNKGAFTIKGAFGTLQTEEVTLEVTDMLGQSVYRSKVMTTDGKINERVILSNTLSNGMYILSLRTDTQSEVFHFVVEQ